MFPGLALSSYNNEWIRDITILRGRAIRKNEPLTSEEQSALRSELWELMRISRIARADALRAASVSAQTLETADEPILNPFDFDEIPDVDVANAT